MKYILPIVSVGLLSLCSLASAVTFQSAIDCQPQYLNPTALVRYNEAGIANHSTTNVNYVSCPVAWSTDSANTGSNVVVQYRDYSYGTSVFCTVVGEDIFGNMFSGSVKYSCATAGGCSTDTQPAFVSTPGVNTYLYLLGPTGSYWYSYTASCAMPANTSGQPTLINGTWTI